ncbi:hypothetical protein L1049_014363 [Liquidambar formosana]|uniref:Histidine-containing phosphotransfer protein n=1 Tax=Liquidambar formosana TaxID=63359 RepID=A0AAP0RS80_LIQFO
MDTRTHASTCESNVYDKSISDICPYMYVHVFVIGIVNDQFYQLQARKDAARPDYVVRAITMYCVNVQKLFSQLSLCIDQNAEVNFHQVSLLARQLQTRSSGIGAEHVRLACAEILRACDEQNKE